MNDKKLKPNHLGSTACRARARRLLLAVSFITTLAAVVFPASGDIKIKSFSTADFGFSRRNWSVVRDNRGMMYFANDSGVVEFDVLKPRLVALPGGSGAYALSKAPDGRIYVGGEGGVG
ncbi:MAG: hypothetical protein GY950_08160, partial [bacterium]|nr:hypothetical protein [bacterium]